MKNKISYNMGKYIFKIKSDKLFIIDNPISDLSSLDFFEIGKIDGIYNYKGQSNEKNFAIALMVNGNFYYYRTVDRTKENITMFKDMIEKIVEVKQELK